MKYKYPIEVQETAYRIWLHSDLDMENALCLRDQIFMDYHKKGINNFEV